MARKKRVNPDTVVDAIIESPNDSMAQIAHKTGLSRSGLDYVLKTPDTINSFRRRLGVGNVTGNAAGSIGRILAALGAITDSVLDDPANLTHQDVDDLTRVLAALTGTLERLAGLTGRPGLPTAGLGRGPTTPTSRNNANSYREAPGHPGLPPKRATRYVQAPQNSTT